MRLLFDADIIAFKAAAATEQPINWGDGIWTLHGYEQDVIDHSMSYMQGVADKLDTQDVLLFLTGANNWRKDILPSYKSNRKDTRKPLMLPFIRQFMVDSLGAIIVDTFEADDLLGIEATSTDDCIIVSEDKDLKTIPAMVYNPQKDDAPVLIPEFTAAWNHMFQTLTGDSTDGYSGCPKVGPVAAKKILQDIDQVEDLWPTVVAAFKKQNLSEEVALQQAQVARICHASDFDKETGKVIPWTPS
jgi:DNA polymerase-1